MCIRDRNDRPQGFPENVPIVSRPGAQSLSYYSRFSILSRCCEDVNSLLTARVYATPHMGTPAVRRSRKEGGGDARLCAARFLAEGKIRRLGVRRRLQGHDGARVIQPSCCNHMAVMRRTYDHTDMW